MQVLRRLRGLRRPGAGLVGGGSSGGGGGEQVCRLGRGVRQGGEAELEAVVLARAFSSRPAPAQRRFSQRRMRAERGDVWTGPTLPPEARQSRQDRATIGLAYLAAQPLQRLPLDARQDVPQELRVEIDLHNLELGVARVQREGRAARLAGLARAGEEVEC